MVFGESPPSESLAAGALEIEARCVHEHDVERGQKIAPCGEQLLVQNVLRRVEIAVASTRSSASSTIAFSAKRAPERKRRSNCPLSRRSSIRPSVADHLRVNRCALAPALDDLQIGGPLEVFLRNTIPGNPAPRRLNLGAHSIRPQSYQWLTHRVHASTVEDQSGRGDGASGHRVRQKLF